MNRHAISLLVLGLLMFFSCLMYGCISEKQPGEDNLISFLLHREGEAFQFHDVKCILSQNALAETLNVAVEQVSQTSVTAGGKEVTPVSHAYIFSPESTSLNGFMSLTIFFQASLAGNAGFLSQLFICRLEGTELVEILPTSIDPDSSSANTPVSRFGKYMLCRIPAEAHGLVLPPTDIRIIVPPTGHQLIVTWEPSPSNMRNTTYRLFWGNPTRSYSYMADTGSELFYLLDGLYNAQTVYLTVSAVVDGKRASSPSDEVNGITRFSDVYRIPTESRLYEPSSITDTTLQLSWSQCYDDKFDEYRLYRALEPHMSGSARSLIMSSEAAAVVTYTETGLTPGTNYYYLVAAKNTYGYITESEVVSVTTEAINSAPVPPWFVQPTGVTSSAVKLQWQSNVESDFDFYRIYRSSQATVDLDDTLVAEITGRAATAYFDQSLTASTTYYFRIFTFDLGGLSTGSNIHYITTSSANYAPPVPALTAVWSAGDQVSLQWSACPDADFASYTVERDTGGETWDFQYGPVTNIYAVTYTDSGLTPETYTYSYRIKTTDTGALSSYSSVISP